MPEFEEGFDIPACEACSGYLDQDGACGDDECPSRVEATPTPKHDSLWTSVLDQIFEDRAHALEVSLRRALTPAEEARVRCGIPWADVKAAYDARCERNWERMNNARPE